MDIKRKFLNSCVHLDGNVTMRHVEVYAQGFAAAAADLSSYQGFNIDEKPDSSCYYTECFGVDCYVI